MSILIRKILDYVIASPITAVSSVVIISCVVVLANRITSETTDIDSIQDIATPVSEHPISSNAIQQDVNQPNIERNVTVIGENNAEVNGSNYSQTTSKNSKRSGVRSAGYGNTNKKARNFTDNMNHHTNINYPSEHVDGSYSNFTGDATDNTNSSHPQININTSLGVSGIANTTNNVTDTINGVADTTNNVTKTTNDGVDTTESDILYPATVEHTVQIDLDETQSISCRRIVENGPPCLCTLTTIDATGTAVEVMNNCSN